MLVVGVVSELIVSSESVEINMKTTTNTKTVGGINSRSAAQRLATILLVVPAGVLAFQDDNPNQVTLSNGDQSAEVVVSDTLVEVTTTIEGGQPRHWVLDDLEAARKLARFFNFNFNLNLNLTNH